MASGASHWRERMRQNVENTPGREPTVTWKSGLKDATVATPAG
jgi:hypothetical protein